MAQGTGDVNERRAGRQAYPEDRFDRVERTRRVGAHRVNARPRYFWQFIIAGLLGFALLTGAGILLLPLLDSAGKLPNSSPMATPGATGTATPQVTAELDPTATIAILNGTEIQNLAAAVDQTIANEQWGTIVFSGSAAESNVAISAVFYLDDADLPAAEGLAAKLGGISTYKTADYADYQARLVVLLGTDYQGPGIDLAEELTAQSGGGAPTGGEQPPAEEPVPAQ